MTLETILARTLRPTEVDLALACFTPEEREACERALTGRLGMTYIGRSHPWLPLDDDDPARPAPMQGTDGGATDGD
jgi:hypothetical protein